MMTDHHFVRFTNNHARKGRRSASAKPRFVALNVRFPEPLDMKLKLIAARRRISLSALIRERLDHDRKEAAGS